MPERAKDPKDMAMAAADALVKALRDAADRATDAATKAIATARETGDVKAAWEAAAGSLIGVIQGAWQAFEKGAAGAAEAVQAGLNRTVPDGTRDSIRELSSTGKDLMGTARVRAAGVATAAMAPAQRAASAATS